MRKTVLLLVVLSVPALTGCEPSVGSERWCEKMAGKSKAEWSLQEAKDYAAHCLLEATTIGSPKWCERLESKPKSDWTAGEAADYAKHCVVR